MLKEVVLASQLISADTVAALADSQSQVSPIPLEQCREVLAPYCDKLDPITLHNGTQIKVLGDPSIVLVVMYRDHEQKPWDFLRLEADAQSARSVSIKLEGTIDATLKFREISTQLRFSSEAIDSRNNLIDQTLPHRELIGAKVVSEMPVSNAPESLEAKFGRPTTAQELSESLEMLLATGKLEKQFRLWGEELASQRVSTLTVDQRFSVYEEMFESSLDPGRRGQIWALALSDINTLLRPIFFKHGAQLQTAYLSAAGVKDPDILDATNALLIQKSAFIRMLTAHDMNGPIAEIMLDLPFWFKEQRFFSASSNQSDNAKLRTLRAKIADTFSSKVVATFYLQQFLSEQFQQPKTALEYLAMANTLAEKRSAGVPLTKAMEFHANVAADRYLLTLIGTDDAPPSDLSFLMRQMHDEFGGLTQAMNFLAKTYRLAFPEYASITVMPGTEKLDQAA